MNDEYKCPNFSFDDFIKNKQLSNEQIELLKECWNHVLSNVCNYIAYIEGIDYDIEENFKAK